MRLAPLFLVTFLSSQIYAKKYIIVHRYINKNAILVEVAFTSVTSCMLTCSSRFNCKGVGFLKDPTTTQNELCKLVSNMTASRDVEDDEDEDYDYGEDYEDELLFVLLDVSVNFDHTPFL